jgi:hypothetical protein
MVHFNLNILDSRREDKKMDRMVASIPRTSKQTQKGIKRGSTENEMLQEIYIRRWLSSGMVRRVVW